MKIESLGSVGNQLMQAVITVGILFTVSGCKPEGGSGPVPPAPQVEFITVTMTTVPDEPEFIGQTEASRPVEIRPQVTGLIKAVLFTEGREIKKGERLYQIDAVPFQAEVAIAKAKIAQAKAKVVQAKQNLARVKPLLAEQAVSQKDVDDAIAEDLSAKAALQGAEADLIKAQFDLDNTLITAPIDGIIERSRYYEGRLVSAQTDLLTVIDQVDPMYVVVSIPETFILKRRRDIEEKKIRHPGVYQLRGELVLLDGSTYQHEGVLDLMEPGLRTDTGSRVVRMTVPNPDRKLLPGQFVKVKFKGDSKLNVVLLPQRAVLQGPQGPFVFVVNPEERIDVRPVQASNWQGDQWLIESGLKADERVVVNGLMKIGPGVPVKAVPLGEALPDGTSPADASKQG